MEREYFGVALVTGCGRSDGIGAAVARVLAAKGAMVVVTDRAVREGQPNDSLDELATELGSASGRALAVRGDVTNEEDCNRAVRLANDQFGGVDIIVNNAGADHGGDRLPLTQVATHEWQRILDVNLTGAFFICRAAIPLMIAKKYGRIINISSLSALRGSARRGAYAASKAGLIGLTLSLATELASEGVTVNAICPGPIETARARSTAASHAGANNIAAALAERASRIPVGRMGKGKDVAGGVAYFADPATSFVTGQILTIDGGIGARMGLG